MKQEAQRERMELLELGERLGYPRLGYARATKVPHDGRIPPGRTEWEKFCGAGHARRIMPALRIARVLVHEEVIPYHPLSGREEARIRGEFDEFMGSGKEVMADASRPSTALPLDLLEEIEEPREKVPLLVVPKKLTKEERRAKNKADWAARRKAKRK